LREFIWFYWVALLCMTFVPVATFNCCYIHLVIATLSCCYIH